MELLQSQAPADRELSGSSATARHGTRCKISWTPSLSKNKKKSLKRKDEWRIMKDEGWMMKDDDFKLLRGFED